MKLFIVIVVFCSFMVSQGRTESKYGISAKYPKDIDIGNNKHVLWAQDFGGGDLSTILEDISCPGNPSSLKLVDDSPEGSRGSARALRMTATGKVNTGSGIYHVFDEDGVEDIYIRYYVKYNENSRYHHTGGAIGSYEPTRNCPAGGAG